MQVWLLFADMLRTLIKRFFSSYKVVRADSGASECSVKRLNHDGALAQTEKETDVGLKTLPVIVRNKNTFQQQTYKFFPYVCIHIVKSRSVTFFTIYFILYIIFIFFNIVIANSKSLCVLKSACSLHIFYKTGLIILCVTHLIEYYFPLIWSSSWCCCCCCFISFSFLQCNMLTN